MTNSPVSPAPLPPREKLALAAIGTVCAALIIATALRRIALSWSEVWGFVTGAFCVYLTVKNNVWNFPVGLANNLFFGILFFESRLFNDFSLQIVYFVLGAWGWWFWVRGGARDAADTPQNQLPIGGANTAQIAICLGLVPLLTLLLTLVSLRLGGAAPFWDALTTALSLVAQGLLGRKWIQNWAFWIAADLIYVPLYFSRGLFLTGALYAGFLVLCVWGYRAWKTELRNESRA